MLKAAARKLPARPAPLPAPARPGTPAPAPASITVLQTHSLPGLVQREVERMILAGELAPGEKLNEAALADSLGVSRGPVREAFRALEESGLVRPQKNRGVYVREITLEEADEIYELRALLDGFAGARAALSADDAAVRGLRTLVADMGRAAAREDVDAFLAANLGFHDRLVQLAGNRKLVALYRRLVNELRLFRRSSLAQGGVLATSTAEHDHIVDCIARRDVEGARRALHDHVMASRERMHKSRSRPVAPDPRSRGKRGTHPVDGHGDLPRLAERSVRKMR